MNKKLIVILLMLIALVGVASAGTFEQPATGVILHDINTSFNVTYTLNNVSNVSFDIYSTGTANTTGTFNKIVFVNKTKHSTGINGSFDPSRLEDGTYTMVANVYNASWDGTYGTEVITAISVYIDFGLPTVPALIVEQNYRQGDDITLTSSVTNGTKVTQCYVLWENQAFPSYTTPTISHSGDSCTITATSALYGNYNFELYSSDDVNNSAKTSGTLVIVKKSSAPPPPTSEVLVRAGQGFSVAKITAQAKENPIVTGGIIVGIILVGLIVFGKKK